MKFSVTKNGQELHESLYNWNERTLTFSSLEDDLVLDFTGLNGVTFKTGFGCTFKTGFGCTFDTRSNCTFNTRSNCTFDTRSNCTFKTGSRCTFKTGSNCTFKTGSYCTFDTGYGCTFDTGYGCVVIRRDVFEIINLNDVTMPIILNKRGTIGFETIQPRKTITIDGKDIEISFESFNELKKQLLEK